MSYLSKLLLLLALAPYLKAQATPEPYSRHNSFTIFMEYSNDSSHIILGRTPNRKLAAFGFQYEHRLIDNAHLTWSYLAEFRPLIVSSDPTSTDVHTLISPGPSRIYPPYTTVAFQCMKGTIAQSYIDPVTNITYASSDAITCARQHTFAQGLSPVGVRISLLPRHRLQPTFSSNGGYMLSTKPLPLARAGSFNFTFEFGGGIEYFPAPHRSFRIEYLVQHYSNHYTADVNPGVDSGFIKFTYALGR